MFNVNVKNVALSKNSANVCLSCNECLFSANHDACVVRYLNDVQKRKKAKSVKQKEKIQWKPTGRVFTTVGNRWVPTGRKFSMEGTMCPITKITPTAIVPIVTRLQTISIPAFIGTVGFGNDHFAAIMGYGDLHIGNILISQVYYIEGLGHNLFSVGQFCDSNLEVAFRKHTCFARYLEGVDLLLGFRGSNLYTVSMEGMMKWSPIFLLSKALKTKSWLWHCRLSHLNLCNKCKFHHNGPCTVKCANCKRVGHLTRDCWSSAATNNQRTLTCYECGNQGHYKSDCPKLKNRNHGNQAEGEVRFGKRGKLNPRYVGPSKVMEKVGSVAYKLELPQELSRVHHTFHVSNLKKCYTDEPLAVPFNGFHIENKLHFIEEPAEIMDRKVKRLKQSRIQIVKVQGNSGRGPEFT
ncbi:integrase, catalytic region, zinc finger, CCHC-type containing protein [Tanacetum coccineum]